MNALLHPFFLHPFFCPLRSVGGRLVAHRRTRRHASQQGLASQQVRSSSLFVCHWLLPDLPAGLVTADEALKGIAGSLCSPPARPPASAAHAPPQQPQGHIGLDTAVWPEGTPGCALDTLARTPLWALGLNYR